MRDIWSTRERASVVVGSSGGRAASCVAAGGALDVVHSLLGENESRIQCTVLRASHSTGHLESIEQNQNDSHQLATTSSSWHLSIWFFNSLEL